MGLSDIMGERAEAAPNFNLLPKSSYIATLNVGEVNVSDPGVDQNTGEETGGTPFVDLNVTPNEGPFAGQGVSCRLHLTPGRIKFNDDGSARAGAYIKFINHACKAITKKPVDDTAATKVGFVVPTREHGEDEAAYGARVRLSFQEFFANLEPSARLSMMVAYTRVASWDGKVVVIELDVESRPRTQGGTFDRNTISAFYATDDPKKGAKFVQLVAHARQEQMLAATASA